MKNQITIQPIVVNIAPNVPINEFINSVDLEIEKELTYWGVYLDDKYVTKTSSKEDAVITMKWMKKWLKETN